MYSTCHGVTDGVGVRGGSLDSDLHEPTSARSLMRGSVCVNEILPAYYCIRKPKPTVMPTTFTRKNVVTLWVYPIASGARTQAGGQLTSLR
jgi:hypothetical protein